MQKLNVFPLNSTVNKAGHLQVGGCDCIDLVREFGTPLYVFDEFTLRTKCRQFLNEFKNFYVDTLVIYASKAFLNKAIARIVKEEGLGLDIVSGGELAVARSVSFPREKIYFHGNNKTAAELEAALDYGIGRMVADNFRELDLINELAGRRKKRQDILLRLSPGIDAHTHKYTTTGILDSKFGFPIATGQAEQAIKKAISLPNLNLIGLHCHLGSPIFETGPYQLAIELMLGFAREMVDKYSFPLTEFSPGGGFAVQYIVDKTAPAIEEYARYICDTLTQCLKKHNFENPRLIIEPGRAIIAQSGVALYTVGSLKEVPGIRTFIFVDGGMGDNIRPALYEAKYEALVANKANEAETTAFTIAGKYCESGDILVKDMMLAPVTTNDIIAIPVTGAYSPSMSSNYNMIPKPAMVMVRDGKARLIRKRESYKDLMNLDLI